MLQGLILHIKIVEAMGSTVDTQIIKAKEDVVHNAEEIGEADVEDVSTGIYHITVGFIECVTIRANS